MKVLIAGASGLVGSELMNLCLNDNSVDTIHVLVRSPLDLNHPKLKQHQVDYNKLEAPQLDNDIQVAFNCLGTTIKNAGSEEAFKRVDYDYVVAFAELCQKIGIVNFVSISAMGASMKSNLFYNRVKGRVEDYLVNDSGLQNLFVVRPSLLLGKRKEFRAGESFAKVVMIAINFLFIGHLKRYKAIQAKKVAQAMLNISKLDESGKKIVENDALFTLAKLKL